MKCEICQKECSGFVGLSNHIKIHKIKTKEYYDKYLKKENEGICLECRKNTSFYNMNIGYHKFCSNKCSNNNKEIKNKKITTSLKNFGVEYSSKIKEIKEKVKKTCLKKYGVDCSSKSEIIKEKSKQTCLKKYGSEYVMQNKEVREKGKITNLKNYGYDNLFKSPQIKNQIKQSNLKNYNVEYPMKCKEVRERGKQTNLQKFGVDNYSKTHEFRELARLNKIKLVESQLQNNQKINPKEGKYESLILDELEYDKIRFLRNQCIGGLFPDGIEENLLIIVEVDEKHHLRECYKKHDRIKDEYYILKGYIPIHIKTSDWFEDSKLQIIKFQETIKFLEQVKQLENKNLL